MEKCVIDAIYRNQKFHAYRAYKRKISQCANWIKN